MALQSRGSCTGEATSQSNRDDRTHANYNLAMEKKVQIFKTFAEADAADAKFDSELTPEQRIEITIELRNRAHPDAAGKGLARVCRVTKLERS